MDMLRRDAAAFDQFMLRHHIFFYPSYSHSQRSCELVQKKKKSSNSNAHSLLNKLECVGVQPVVLPQSHFTENTHFWVWTQNWEQKISIIMPELWSSSTLHTQQTHQLQITQLEKKECWKQRRSMSDVDFNSDLMICVCLCLLSSKKCQWYSTTLHQRWEQVIVLQVTTLSFES